MLIYDRFATFTSAAMFAQAVIALDEDRTVIVATERLDEPRLALLAGESAELSTDLVRVQPIDYVFPFGLTAPIVYVSRSDDDEATPEDELAELAVTFDGAFAGT